MVIKTATYYEKFSVLDLSKIEVVGSNSARLRDINPRRCCSVMVQSLGWYSTQPLEPCWFPDTIAKTFTTDEAMV
jgi:hypothetical protein